MTHFKIIDDPKIATSDLIKECKKYFDVYCYWNDDQLNDLFKAPKETTTRYFKATVEAEDCKGQSRDDMKGKPLMTLREYAILTVQYFKETGKHLDVDGWTIFNDRLPGGGVANGDWYPDYSQVFFYWLGADYRSSYAGGREAVSLDSAPLVSSDPLESRIQALEEDMKKIKKFLIV